MQNLTNKIALVTGSTRGLGKGIAEVLARCGAEVIINCPVFEPDVTAVTAQIESFGGKAVFIPADISSEREVEKLFQEISSRYSRLDILVNNAGISQAKDIFDITDDDWHHIINTNLAGGFYCSRQAMKLMKHQHDGRIVFVSSVVAHQGALFGHAHYAASKSGQLGLMKTLARTGASLGINVNAVAPGIMETELLFNTHGEGGVAKLAETIPLGLGNADDVGNAVAFLCSDEARYITGATLDVNGGLYLR